MQAYTHIKNSVSGVEFINKAGVSLSTCWRKKMCLQCAKRLSKRERTFCSLCKIERQKPTKCDVHFCKNYATVRVFKPERHEGAQLCPKHSDLLEIEEAEQLKNAWV